MRGGDLRLSRLTREAVATERGVWTSYNLFPPHQCFHNVIARVRSFDPRWKAEFAVQELIDRFSLVGLAAFMVLFAYLTWTLPKPSIDDDEPPADTEEKA
jgi:hypothetical protein